MKLEIHRARVNIKSLAAEALIIKREISKVSGKSPEYIKANLQSHKAHKLKPEARLAHLALGFLKGMPKSKIETSAKPIDVAKLYRKIKIFAHESWMVTQEQVSDWLRT